MEKKYGFTGYVLHKYGRELKQVVALKDFGDIKKGQFGGYIESEDNLSQDGECWVQQACIYGKAKVYENALVMIDARVYGNAKVHGYSMVAETAAVYGDADVQGCVFIGGHAKVYGHAQLFNHVEVSGRAKVYENACLCENVQIFGKAEIFGKAQIDGKTKVYDNAKVYGEAQVSGNSEVFEDAEVFDSARIGGNAKICHKAQVGNGVVLTHDEKVTEGYIPMYYQEYKHYNFEYRFANKGEWNELIILSKIVNTDKLIELIKERHGWTKREMRCNIYLKEIDEDVEVY